MKKLFSFLIGLSIISIAQAQSVGVGTTSSAASAQLDVMSTTKGFLPPRMTYAQRNLISSPVAGLVVWCIDCDELQVYNGTVWKNMSGVAASGPTLSNVTICNEVWMVKNLDVSTYRNGDPIPQVTDPAVWSSLTIGAWCWYNNDPAYADYGKLYNWYAVRDPRGLAPVGWHVPDNAEWAALANCLGGSGVAGGKMKETGTTHWQSPNVNATNSSGFTGLPGGRRNQSGTFSGVNQFGYWWSSFLNEGSFVSYQALSYNSEITYTLQLSKNNGHSVRCIRD